MIRSSGWCFSHFHRSGTTASITTSSIRKAVQVIQLSAMAMSCSTPPGCDSDSATLGSTTFSGVGTDTFTLSGTGSLGSANAGHYGGTASGTGGTPSGTAQVGVSGLTLVPISGISNNYTLVGGNDTYDISQAVITLTGVRQYDGTQTVNGNGGGALIDDSLNVIGILSHELPGTTKTVYSIPIAIAAKWALSVLEDPSFHPRLIRNSYDHTNGTRYDMGGRVRAGPFLLSYNKYDKRVEICVSRENALRREDPMWNPVLRQMEEALKGSIETLGGRLVGIFDVAHDPPANHPIQPRLTIERCH